MNINLPTFGMSGQFRLVVSKGPGERDVKHDTGFFNNLITDIGMNRIGVFAYRGSIGASTGLTTFRSLCGRFVVGAGSAAPQVTDTALQSPVAFASADVSRVSESSSYTRGWYELTVTHEFGQGQAAGNLSEIGIQHASPSGPLWSRALILDGAGNPTTITVLADDYLTCYYTLRIMIPQEDAVFNIDVDYGDDEIVPTVVTARPLNANDSSITRGWGFNCAKIGDLSSSYSDLHFYPEGLASPTSSLPPGSPVTSPVHGWQEIPYIDGSFVRYLTRTTSPNQLNSTNLSTARLHALMGAWQINFNPPLQKNNTQTMQLTFGYSWARA